jgi:hypothetical protein
MAHPLGLTDGQFDRAIKRVSNNNALSYTERQLWYELLRTMPTPPRLGCAGAASLALLAPLWMLTGALGTSASAGATPGRLPFDRFQNEILARWRLVHGKPVGLLEASEIQREMPAPPDEIREFSFDRALVVEHADLAAMLVANRFHFENNCAVLAGDGAYPAGPAFTSIRAMLARNPRLVVFCLHDASPAGAGCARSLRTADWFPDVNVRIVDLGLTPSQAMRARLPEIVGEKTASQDFPLPNEEAEWLASGKSAELSALRPAALMKVAWQGFATAASLGDQGSWNDDGIWLMGYGWGPGLWMMDSGFSGADHWGAGSPSIEAGAPDNFG